MYIVVILWGEERGIHIIFLGEGGEGGVIVSLGRFSYGPCLVSFFKQVILQIKLHSRYL